MKILFAGGGTLGPVTPLLAVARRMKAKRRDVEFAWVGTPDGPEREPIEKERIKFYSIPTAKLPRYPSIAWLTWPRDYFRAKKAAEELVVKISPDLVVGAGGFTQTPIMRAAAKRKITCAIHQLDFEPGLSNKLVAPLCASVTTSFSYGKPPFRGVKSERVATPTRFAGVPAPDKEAGAHRFFLDHAEPIVFVFGGGTGALAINDAVASIQETLLKSAQIIHATGKGKMGSLKKGGRYFVKEFLDEQDMLFAYAAADVVVCRAGMGALTDLASLKKAAIVVPIPNSHQEANAKAVVDATILVSQEGAFEEQLENAITNALSDPRQRLALGKKLFQLLPTDDGSALAERWLSIHNEKIPG